MISPFIINDKNLFLDRYPINQINRSLQAWDAADEYLVNHVADNNLLNSNSNVLIFNDNFGGLALNYPEHNVYTVTDSFISIKGTQHNAEQNSLAMENIQQLSSLDKLPTNIQVVLYKIPKNKTMLVEQLQQIRKSLTAETIFIAADKAKSIQSATLKLFEKYLGTTTTSLAVKKARLVFCQLDAKMQSSSNELLTQIKTWSIENQAISIMNLSLIHI